VTDVTEDPGPADVELSADMVISLSAKGLTHGEIAAHLAEFCGAAFDITSDGRDQVKQTARCLELRLPVQPEC